ncbi:unnamed protein product, partial [Ectocarpus sp. 12 AP-2014]
FRNSRGQAGTSATMRAEMRLGERVRAGGTTESSGTPWSTHVHWARCGDGGLALRNTCILCVTVFYRSGFYSRAGNISPHSFDNPGHKTNPSKLKRLPHHGHQVICG